MKPLVIIVPGLEAPRWPRPFSYGVKLYSWYFELNAGRNSWLRFAEYLERQGIEAFVAEPIFWFSKKHIQAAGKELARLVDSHAGRTVILFGYSLGTAVIEEAIQQCSNTSNISKVLSVAAPHSRNMLSVPPSVQVINIYSDADTYLDFSNRMLYLRGYKRLVHADNVPLDGLKHAAFAKPALYDFYLKHIFS